MVVFIIIAIINHLCHHHLHHHHSLSIKIKSKFNVILYILHATYKPRDTPHYSVSPTHDLLLVFFNDTNNCKMQSTLQHLYLPCQYVSMKNTFFPTMKMF